MKIEYFERPSSVDTDNTFNNTNFTTLNGALSSYQTILPCTQDTEVWSCVSMGNSSLSIYLHYRDHELWAGHDHHPSCPTLYPLNWQEICIFLFLLQHNHPLQV